MADFFEYYKNYRWIEKRDEILERDQYECKSCGNKADILQVHHIIYIKDKKPWLYDNDNLITLCADCHKFITETLFKSNQIMRNISYNADAAEQLLFLLKRLEGLDKWQIRKFGKAIECNTLNGRVIYE